jgi:hypothetical protein
VHAPLDSAGRRVVDPASEKKGGPKGPPYF